MSRRGCLILGALILLPFLIVGIVRMGRKAARRAKYGATASMYPGPMAAAPVDAGLREGVYLLG